MKRNKFLGFTLAEVLITLSILGIVAAISIPNLVQRYTDKVTVIKVKKTYSTLYDAFERTRIENNYIYNLNIFRQNMITSLNGNEISCGNAMYYSSYKNLKGDNPSNKNCLWCNYPRCVKLKDGTSVSLMPDSDNSCNSYDSCIMAYIDINGPKAPNKFGVDTFMITFGKNKNYNYSKFDYSVANSKNYCNKDSSDRKNGTSCLMWIVNKGNMEYLHRDVSSEWNFSN